MSMRPTLLVTLVSLTAFACWAAGCGSDSEADTSVAGAAGAADDGGVEAAEPDADEDAGDTLPEPICSQGTRWSSGTQAFKEATADWKLDVIGATGVRIVAVDYDGDGWADLSVAKTGAVGDDFAEGGARTTWLLRNDGKHAFADATKASGLRQTRVGTDPNKGRAGDVVSFGDVDGDGDLDAFVGLGIDPKNPGDETTELMRNKGDGTFELGPADSALRGVDLPSFGAPATGAFVDFDRDGKLDIWVPQAAPNSSPQQDRLYQGDGAGRFTDVTIDRGLKTSAWSSIATLNAAKAHTYAWSGTVCDLNNDGNPELLSASYGRAPNHLWQNTGNGEYKFVNRSIASGYAFDERVDWTDNESARCWCKLHPTDEDCAGVPAPKYIQCTKDDDAFRWDHSNDREPFRLGGNSAATLCTDVDNDGWFDLVTGEIMHWDVGASSDPAELLVNAKETDVRFTRPGNEATGLTRKHTGVDWNEGIMSGAVLDFDNDGWIDLYWGDSDYPGAHGLLYQQDSAGHFVAVPIAEGIDHHRSHGAAVADFDHDGDLDIVVGHSTARCSTGGDCYPTAQIRYFENVIGQGGNFVQVVLEGGAGTNRAAIGARVTVKAGGVTQTRDVGGGHGHFGAQDDLALHFGLGAECTAEVTIRWPDASLTTETFTLPAGHRFAIAQGGKPKVLWSRAKP